ncbi:hypothetical protein F2Q69_00024299 [Brassica cretica]|uniref:Uncharacterized protein n=1 Tax=Brassica cretica TaxID=69181 RepID=A0A8S9QE80_BRACR|nr:hypothetical protein F2Q69_00024299 [Brassica cretica]
MDDSHICSFRRLPAVDDLHGSRLAVDDLHGSLLVNAEATVAVSSATLPTGRVVVVVAAAVNAVMVPAAVTVASEAATLSGV